MFIGNKNLISWEEDLYVEGIKGQPMFRKRGQANPLIEKGKCHPHLRPTDVGFTRRSQANSRVSRMLAISIE